MEVKSSKQNISKKIATWIEELRMLSQIAKIEPQAAYTCFTSGFKHKMTYCLRTIPNIGDILQQLDDVISTEFIPAITGGINCSTVERNLLSLPPKFGGFGIPIFREISQTEYANSILVTENLKKQIIQQNRQFNPAENMNGIKNKIKLNKREKNKNNLAIIRNELTDHQNRLNKINQETGPSSWLTTLPIKDEGYVLISKSFGI